MAIQRRAVLIATLAAWPVLATAAATPARAASAIDLDGTWLFHTDPRGQGEADAWSERMPTDSKPVDVPSSWNAGPDGTYDGVAWYSRKLVLPADLARLHLELHFGATFYRSVIWVNGRRVGMHEGGFTAYTVDASSRLHAGANTIAVELDNRPGVATIPGYALRQAPTGTVWYDWWRNGGIVRPVSLVASEGGLIRRQRISSVVSDEAADIQDAVAVENVSNASMRYVVSSALFAPDGHEAAHADASLTLAAKGTGIVPIPFHVDRPDLWNVGAARLYRVVTSLRTPDGRALDQLADRIGLRRIEIRDRHLLVNGHPVRLTGISRHEDSPWEGLAETAGTIKYDWNDLAALHVTLTRPVHYPQPPEVLDQADQDGILLVPEIPVWQMRDFQLADPRLRALAARMMTEMILADGNHPSIFAWSVCNESDVRLPGGAGYVQAMKALIRTLDPARFVSLADADVAIAPWHDEPALHDVDFIMANAYFGNWDGPMAKIDPWLDFMNRTYPDKMLVISEFGWPGIFSPDPATADRDRINNFTASLNAFARRDFVAGAILWSYQDYRSPRNLATGLTDGYVDHGLVDENRQRKPSYHAWELLNRPLSISLAWRQGADGPTGFDATLTPNGPERLPNYPLLDYRARWSMRAADGSLIASGEQALPGLLTTRVLSANWPHPSPVGGGLLHFVVLDSAGYVAAQASIPDYRMVIGAAPFRPDLQNANHP